MRHIVISAVFRPHITDRPDGGCWCLPNVDGDPESPECVIVHNCVEGRPDYQPRMSCYSEQRTLGS